MGWAVCLSNITADVSRSCCACLTYSMCALLLLLQPARLNVYKNDDETWDYTGELGRFITHPVLFDFLFFLFNLPFLM